MKRTLTTVCLCALLLLSGCTADPSQPGFGQDDALAVQQEVSQALAENLETMLFERLAFGTDLEEQGLTLRVGEVTALADQRYTYQLTLQNASGQNRTYAMQGAYRFNAPNGYFPAEVEQAIGAVTLAGEELLIADTERLLCQPLDLSQEPSVFYRAEEQEVILMADRDPEGGYLLLTELHGGEDLLYRFRAYQTSGELRSQTDVENWGYAAMIPHFWLTPSSEFGDLQQDAVYLNSTSAAWLIGEDLLWVEGQSPAYTWEGVDFPYDEEHLCTVYSSGVAAADWGGEWKFLTFDGDLLLPSFSMWQQYSWSLDPEGPVLRVQDGALDAVWDFGTGTVDIQYRYTPEDLVDEQPLATSPGGRYAVYELSVGGAGDAGWANFAVHDRETDTIERMDVGYLIQSLTFLGDETIVVDYNEPTLRTYHAATLQRTDLAPVLPTNADGEPYWVLWLGADEARDCLLVLCREPGWIEEDFSETAPVTLAIYDRAGNLLTTVASDGEIRKQKNNWVYRPRVEMQDGVLSLYDDYWEGMETVHIPYAEVLSDVQ